MEKRKKQEEPEAELYAKDKSLLQLPLFHFQRSRKTRIVHKWQEKDKKTGEIKKCELICSGNGGSVPGSLEQDIYAACLRLWVTKSRPTFLTVSYAEIAEILGLDKRRWSGGIKKSLFKMGRSRYEFKNCFIYEGKRIAKSCIFSLFESFSFKEEQEKDIGTRTSIEVNFPVELQRNIEVRYYQWLDFALYRRIKTGLSRRLYEYLEKRRYHERDGVYEVGEYLLCRWMPIADCNKTRIRKKIAEIAQNLVDVGYLSHYEKEDSKWYFTYVPRKPLDPEKPHLPQQKRSRYDPTTATQRRPEYCTPEHIAKMRDIAGRSKTVEGDRIVAVHADHVEAVTKSGKTNRYPYEILTERSFA